MVKLTGSKTEQEFRDILIKSHKSLFHENCNERLLNALRTIFPNMKTAYFISHIPEQGEDLYTLLINDSVVVKVDINKYNYDEEPIVEIFDINDFKKGKSKIDQIKLAVAVDLAKKNMESCL